MHKRCTRTSLYNAGTRRADIRARRKQTISFIAKRYSAEITARSLVRKRVGLFVEPSRAPQVTVLWGDLLQRFYLNSEPTPCSVLTALIFSSSSESIYLGERFSRLRYKEKFKEYRVVLWFMTDVVYGELGGRIAQNAGRESRGRAETEHPGFQ